jgi:hypothetical protein
MTRVGVVQLNAPNAAYKTKKQISKPKNRGAHGLEAQLMSGLGVTLVAHTHLKGSVWSTSRRWKI